MSMQAITGNLIAPFDYWNGGGFWAWSAALDAADEFCGAVFRIPESGTLDKIGFRVSSVSSADTLKVSLETVDPTTGRPTGTLYASGASGSVVASTSNACYYVTLNGGNGITVTKNDLVAVKITYDNWVSGNMLIAIYVSGISALPYSYTYTGGTWGTQVGIPNFILSYSDPDKIAYIEGMFPAIYTSVPSFNVNSNPNKRGNRFRFPFAVRCTGIQFFIDADDDLSVILYDADGVTALKIITIDKDVRSSAAGSIYKEVFDTPVTLLANTYYRLVFAPQSSTNITYHYASVLNDSSREAMCAMRMGNDCVWTHCNGTPTEEGSWTQILTVRMMSLGILYDAIDVGVGGGAVGPFGTIR
jgi:hypothetical protein